MAGRLGRRELILAGAAMVMGACTPRGGELSGRQRLPGYTSTPTTPAKAAPTPQPVTPRAPQPAAIEELPGDGYVIVPRASWTSLPIKGNNNPMGKVTRITVHHTGEHGNWADLPDVEVVRRIEQYHRGERNWACIGYHFIVGRDGRVYEGRPAKFQGAHVSTENENNLGISVIGDFNGRLPSRRQLSALKALLNDKRQKYGVPARRIYGHRELHASQCPGDQLMGWVRSYRAG